VTQQTRRTRLKPAPRPLSFSRRLRLGQLLAVVATGPALLITAAVAVGIVTISHQDSVRDNLIDKVEPANAASLRLLIAMLNQETGIRGYELTGNRAFLQPYTLGVTQAREYEQNLKGYAVPGTAADLAAVLGRIDIWESQTVTPALRRSETNFGHSSARIDISLKSKAQFDAIRASVGALQNMLTAKVKRVKAQLDDSARATEIALSVIGLALIISVLGAGLLLRRFVTRPIGALADAARRVADGNLDHSLALPGPLDLELLSQDVEGMRLRLLSELTSSQRMHEQLSLAATDLQRSNSELEQFAYVASHDLQEPLRKVTSFVQLLESRYGDQFDERGHQYIDFAVDGAKRMQQLINDLLAFSRVGRSGQPLTPTALNELVTAAIADLDGVIKESGAEISVAELPTVPVEPALIRAVFQNLIANAIKFRSERSPQVTIDAERDGEGWLFSFSDNGIGIDPQYAERIFVIFQRLHTREAYPGTGIGLAMCRKIIEHHGGRMWLDQAHTGGTRMWFTLPAVPPTTSSRSQAE
jgi:signal transduction histidine kinase